MGPKQWAAIAAMIAVSTPCLAFDLKDAGPSTMFYISIPLDFSAPKKEREWAYGIQLQGKREYQAVNIDSKMLSFLPLGGLEAKWLIAGVVAVGAAVAVGGGGGGSSTTQALQAQQTQHQQQIATQQAAATQSGGSTQQQAAASPPPPTTTTSTTGTTTTTTSASPAPACPPTPCPK